MHISVENYFYIDNYADAGDSGGKGDVATGGNVSVGNITQTGAYENYVDVYNAGRKLSLRNASAVSGSVTIGNVPAIRWLLIRS